jgi:hypothetical protein
MIFATDISIPVAYSGALILHVCLPWLWLPQNARFYFTRCPLASPYDSHGLNRGIENP